MSLARVYTVKKARKDQGPCGKCGRDIRPGDPYFYFAVGYRGFKRVRCANPDCYPRPSERESSLVAGVYAAQESFDVSGATDVDDIVLSMSEVAEAVREVAQQYLDAAEAMGGAGTEMEERADMLEAVADDLDGWQPDTDGPDRDEYVDADTGLAITDDDGRTFSEAWEDWMVEVREAATDAVNDLDLP